MKITFQTRANTSNGCIKIKRIINLTINIINEIHGFSLSKMQVKFSINIVLITFKSKEVLLFCGRLRKGFRKSVILRKKNNGH